MKKRSIQFLFAVITALFLVACSNDNNENSHMNQGEKKTQHENNSNNMKQEGMDHGNMNPSGTGEVPKGLKVAGNPKFKVGSQVIINSGHMVGMKGAEATVVGAYDTTVYTISYTPTTGGEKVTNHKWIIHEEIKDASDKPYKSGDEVVVEAFHMNGMMDATAVIDSAQQTIVYMVDYTSTTGGEKVTNHKWVTEDELSAK